MSTPNPTPSTHSGRSGRGAKIALISLSIATAALIAVVAVVALKPATAHADPVHHHHSVPITPTPAPIPSNHPAVPVTPANCQVGQLRVSLGAAEGTAGATVYPIVFTNTSSTTCELQGYPGVSMVGAHGVQIGAPAAWTGTNPITAQTIQPGHSVTAQLTVEIAANIPGATPTPALGLRIYPPHSYDAVYLPVQGLVGASQANVVLMSLQPVAAS